MKPITIADWLGPYAHHPAAQATVILKHGAMLLAAVNEFLELAEMDGVEVDFAISGSGNGGFRPPDCPVGALFSAHKDGRAVDVADPKRSLAEWALDEGRPHAERLGLWFEHPQWTRSWLHCQIGAPRSGNRFFVPYADLVASPPTCSPLDGQREAGVTVFNPKRA